MSSPKFGTLNPPGSQVITPESVASAAADAIRAQVAADADRAEAAALAIPTTESLQDLIAAMFQGGTHTNASITYDDNAGTLNITAVGGTGGGSSLSQEEVEDFVGRLVVQGTGIAVTYDDAGNVLRIALSGESFTTAEKNKLGAIAAGATANQTDAHLLARSNHTGTQAIATVAGLQAVIDDLTARIVALEAGTVVTPPPSTATIAAVDDTSTGFILHA